MRLPPDLRESSPVFFDALEIPEGMMLRAGYSANADIVIQRAEDVLVLPERVLVFRGDSTFVRLPPADPQASPEERHLETGMSDGIRIEVKSGVALGDQVLDKETREIE